MSTHLPPQDSTQQLFAPRTAMPQWAAAEGLVPIPEGLNMVGYAPAQVVGVENNTVSRSIVTSFDAVILAPMQYGLYLVHPFDVHV